MKISTTLNGKGCIVGDRENHLGTKGEWGFGINVLEAKNTKIIGLNVRDCWGDCIYVGGKSRDILIKDCELSNSRRQGISITSADRVKVINCNIRDVAGTEPEYAVDVEPDPGEYCDNIEIIGVNADNCKGGFMVYGRVPRTKTGKITIKNCTATRVSKSAFRFIDCDAISIESCAISQSNEKETVFFDRVKKISKKGIVIK